MPNNNVADGIEVSEGAKEAALSALKLHDDETAIAYADLGELPNDPDSGRVDAVLDAYNQYLQQHPEEAAELAGFEYMHTDHSFGDPVDLYRRLTPEKESGE